MAIALKGADGNPLTTRDVDASSINIVRVYGKLSFSGTYTNQAGGGDIVDFSKIGDKLEGSTLLNVWVGSQAPLANQYVFKPGTDLTNGSLAIYAAGGAEL